MYNLCQRPNNKSVNSTWWTQISAFCTSTLLGIDLILTSYCHPHAQPFLAVLCHSRSLPQLLSLAESANTLHVVSLSRDTVHAGDPINMHYYKLGLAIYSAQKRNRHNSIKQLTVTIYWRLRDLWPYVVWGRWYQPVPIVYPVSWKPATKYINIPLSCWFTW